MFLTESVKIKNPPRRRVEGAESEDASLTRCFLTEGTNHRYGNELIVVGIDQISAAGSCRFPPQLMVQMIAHTHLFGLCKHTHLHAPRGRGNT